MELYHYLLYLDHPWQVQACFRFNHQFALQLNTGGKKRLWDLTTLKLFCRFLILKSSCLHIIFCGPTEINLLRESRVERKFFTLYNVLHRHQERMSCPHVVAKLSIQHFLQFEHFNNIGLSGRNKRNTVQTPTINCFIGRPAFPLKMVLPHWTHGYQSKNKYHMHSRSKLNLTFICFIIVLFQRIFSR